MERYDVAVIGAGSAGDPLARALANAGRRTALIERGPFGGSCTNRGCTPSKALEATARIARLARTADRWGVRGVPSGDVRVDLAAAQARKDAMQARFRRDTGAEFAKTPRLRVLHGAARFVGPHDLEVTHGGTSERIAAEVIVINTGSRPAVPPVAGLADVPFLTSDDLLDIAELPEHLGVLGGNYIGLELGQAFLRFGSRVTVVEAAEHILPGEDDEIAEELARCLAAEGMDLRTGRKATRVERAENGGVRVTLEATDGEVAGSFTCSHLLVATGRAPNTDALNLAAAGVETDEAGYVRTDARLRTSVPHIWAAGDAAGSPQYNHVAYDDFRVLRSQLLGDRERTTEGRLVPYAVFTDPPLGRVGLSEREAREQGHNVRVARLPVSEVARAIETSEEAGLLKAVVDADSGRLLGAAVLGQGGPEVIGMIQVAMLGDLPWAVFRDNVFAHPTLGEAVGDLFRDWEE
jgi:pyruvate/2-oxoglutarate dehydrogenase complex dihydrolipoamide dehydrogenase (E3) component